MVYTTATHRWYANPAIGQAWTKADVDALSAGVQVEYVDQGSLRATQVYVSVRSHTTVPSEARVGGRVEVNISEPYGFEAPDGGLGSRAIFVPFRLLPLNASACG